MLKISGSKPDGQTHVLVDPYVPLKIELDSSSPETPLYWRALTEDGSLVEVGLSPIDGSLCKVTLTTISRSRVVRSKLRDEDRTSEIGVPQVDMSLWPVQRREFAENFVDEVVPLELMLDDSTATLWFSRCSEQVSWQRLENVFFGVTKDGLLCCIEVRGLNEVQIATITEAIEADANSYGDEM